MAKIGRHPETGLRAVGVVHEIRDAKHPSSIGSGPEDRPGLVTRYDLQELILVPDDEDLGFVSQCFLAVDGYRVNASLVPPMRDFLLSPSGI